MNRLIVAPLYYFYVDFRDKAFSQTIEIDGGLLRVTITKSEMSFGKNRKRYKRISENCKLLTRNTI